MEVHSLSKVDKIIEEALKEYPIGSQVSYKDKYFSWFRLKMPS